VATLGLVNIGALATGVLSAPGLEAETILVESGLIAAIGAASRTAAAAADVVVDCHGTTVIPGLIDSHCHVVLGDYTPRQKTVDFLDSYVHGGITSVVSAGEGVHAPGRPHSPVAARRLRSRRRSASRTFTRTA
jgi:enamidase